MSNKNTQSPAKQNQATIDDLENHGILSDLVLRDMPNFCSLIDLLRDHPDVQSHETLSNAVEAIKYNFVHIWTKVEVDVFDKINLNAISGQVKS